MKYFVNQDIIQRKIKRLLLVGLQLGLGLSLSACAVVQSSSNKDLKFSQKLDRVSVLSKIATIEYKSGPLKPAKPFAETFRQNLMAEFAKRGLSATYKDIPAGDLSMTSSKDMREKSTPNTWLVIQIKNTSSMMYAGFTHLDMVVFDLSLYSVASGQRVWRAEVALDTSLDVPKWSESTAVKFVNEIFRLLAKDALI